MSCLMSVVSHRDTLLKIETLFSDAEWAQYTGRHIKNDIKNKDNKIIEFSDSQKTPEKDELLN